MAKRAVKAYTVEDSDGELSPMCVNDMQLVVKERAERMGFAGKIVRVRIIRETDYRRLLAAQKKGRG